MPGLFMLLFFILTKASRTISKIVAKTKIKEAISFLSVHIFKASKIRVRNEFTNSKLEVNKIKGKHKKTVSKEETAFRLPAKNIFSSIKIPALFFCSVHRHLRCILHHLRCIHC